jgi:hypothetical protein
MQLDGKEHQALIHLGMHGLKDIFGMKIIFHVDKGISHE